MSVRSTLSAEARSRQAVAVVAATGVPESGRDPSHRPIWARLFSTVETICTQIVAGIDRPKLRTAQR
jgi:hypothetical protein